MTQTNKNAMTPGSKQFFENHISGVENLLSSKQLGEVLGGKTAKQVRDLVYMGQIPEPTKRLGKSLLWEKSEIKKFIASLG